LTEAEAQAAKDNAELEAIIARDYEIEAAITARADTDGAFAIAWALNKLAEAQREIAAAQWEIASAVHTTTPSRPQGPMATDSAEPLATPADHSKPRPDSSRPRKKPGSAHPRA